VYALALFLVYHSQFAASKCVDDYYVMLGEYESQLSSWKKTTDVSPESSDPLPSAFPMTADERRTNEILNALDVLVPPGNVETISNYPVEFSTLKSVGNSTKVIMQFVRNNTDVQTQLTIFDLREQMYKALDPTQSVRVLQIPVPKNVTTDFSDPSNPENVCSLSSPDFPDHNVVIGYGTQMFATQARFEFHVYCDEPAILATITSEEEPEETQDGKRHLLSQNGGCGKHERCREWYQEARLREGHIKYLQRELTSSAACETRLATCETNLISCENTADLCDQHYDTCEEELEDCKSLISSPTGSPTSSDFQAQTTLPVYCSGYGGVFEVPDCIGPYADGYFKPDYYGNACIVRGGRTTGPSYIQWEYSNHACIPYQVDNMIVTRREANDVYDLV